MDASGQDRESAAVHAADFDKGQLAMWRELYGDVMDRYQPVGGDWSLEWRRLDWLVRVTLARAVAEYGGGGGPCRLCQGLEGLALGSLRFSQPGVAKCALSLLSMMRNDMELCTATEEMAGWAVEHDPAVRVEMGIRTGFGSGKEYQWKAPNMTRK